MSGPSAFRPIILAVDDEPEDLERVERELGKRYEADYGMACEVSPGAGLRRLQDLKSSGEDVAVVLADQRMPGMEGIEFLSRAHQLHPSAKRLLLIDPMDGVSFVRASGAMALGRIDYVEYKPGPPPNERFHQVITGFLREWTWPYHSERNAVVRIVGERRSPRSYEIRDLLERYAVPHAFYAADSGEGRALLRRAGRTAEHLPVCVLFDGRVLVDPSNEEAADALNAVSGGPEAQESDFDVVVVGGGPAGLAAAVYGTSEGLSTLVLEGEAVGGLAGTSSMIRNYLGFAQGISGQELAYQASRQASLFGARFRLMRRATDISGEGDRLVVALSDCTGVSARSVILATGASYRRLGVPRTEWLPQRFERDEKGFVLTGQALLHNGRLPYGWSLERPPMALETSVPGVFAAGDVRHQSVKRVASAVGEGSIAIRLIHEYLG